MTSATHNERTGSRAGPVVAAALCALGLALAAGLWALRTPEGAPWGGRFLLGQAVAFAAYAAALALVRLRRAESVLCVALILTFAVGFRITVYLRAPRLSTDIYRYIWDGRVANAGINPYRYAPIDPEVRALRDEGWRRVNFKRVPTIYPPAAQILFAGLWRLGGDPERRFRLAFLLFDLVAMALVLRLLARLRRPPAWVLAYAWSPLVITEFAAGGHVDAAALCLLTAALALAPSSRDRSAGWSAAMLGLSIMTKGYAALALPFLVRRYGWRYLAWVAAACAAVSAPFLGAGRGLFGGLAAYLEGWQENASLLLVIGHAVQPLTDRPLLVAKGIAAAILVALVGWLVTRPRYEDEAVLRDTFVIFAAGLLLGGPVLPWYLTATVPFLCFWPVAGWVLFTGLVSLAYYAHWSAPAWADRLSVIEYGAVYLLLAAQGAWWLWVRRIGRAARTPS